MATTKTAKRRKKKPAPKPKEAQPPRLRLDKVTFEGFKGFEEPFTLEIPPPLAEGDLDITVIGGVNGTGKTAALEGICLSILAGMCKPEHPKAPAALFVNRLPIFDHDPERARAIVARLINVNSAKARLACTATIGGDAVNLTNELRWFNEAPILRPVGSRLGRLRHALDAKCSGTPFGDPRGGLETLLLLGEGVEPVLSPPVLYFHSYRKVYECNPRLSDLADGSTGPMSGFKVAALTAVFAKGGSIEDRDPDEGHVVLDHLNALMERLVGGRIKDQVRTDGNELDIRVQPLRGGESIPFDALSSGQKEIVSTLFLIWQYSRKQPCIVLIDEPELHLHPQWHYEFVRQLEELAPHNQYIIATHSGEIARSVEQDRIFLLSR